MEFWDVVDVEVAKVGSVPYSKRIVLLAVPLGLTEPLIVAVVDVTDEAGWVMALGSKPVVVAVFDTEEGGQLPVRETPDTAVDELPTF